MRNVINVVSWRKTANVNTVRFAGRDARKTVLIPAIVFLLAVVPGCTLIVIFARTVKNIVYESNRIENWKFG
jgi:hypothetical protein